MHFYFLFQFGFSVAWVLLFSGLEWLSFWVSVSWGCFDVWVACVDLGFRLLFCGRVWDGYVIVGCLCCLHLGWGWGVFRFDLGLCVCELFLLSVFLNGLLLLRVLGFWFWICFLGFGFCVDLVMFVGCLDWLSCFLRCGVAGVLTLAC